MTDSHHKYLVIDLQKCDQCESCSVVCAYHDSPDAEVHGVSVLRERATFALVCRRCTIASCINACVFDALERGPGGVIQRHNLRCVSCKMCAHACPFGTIYTDMLSFYQVNCDLCLEQDDTTTILCNQLSAGRTRIPRDGSVRNGCPCHRSAPGSPCWSLEQAGGHFMKGNMVLLEFLLFPGLLFTAVAGLLTSWVDRKVTALVQMRVGPPLLQPFYDIRKLFIKETCVPEGGATGTVPVGPFAGSRCGDTGFHDPVAHLAGCRSHLCR